MILFLRKSNNRMGYTVLNADNRNEALSTFRKGYGDDYEVLMLSEKPEEV